MEYKYKAFVSCSLSKNDEHIVRYFENILRKYNIEPYGTVGRHAIEAKPIPISMKSHIKECDFVVVIATKRYLQSDLKGQNTSRTISEMIQVESGLAYMADKPIVVITFDDVHIGNFLPKITQYVSFPTIYGFEFKKKRYILHKLIISALKEVENNRQLKSNSEIWSMVVGGLSIFGFIKMISK